MLFPFLFATVLWGVVLGFAFGALYDVLRILRVARALRHADAPVYGTRMSPCSLHCYLEKKREKQTRPPMRELVLLFFEDFFFCISFGCAIAVLVFAMEDGVVRWYSLAACAAGFFGYRQTLGRPVMRSATVILALCRRVLAWTFLRTLAPLFACLRRLFGAIATRLGHTVGRWATRRYASRLPARMVPPIGNREKKGRKR